MHASLTQEEIAQVQAILQKLEPGMLPFPIFLQIARLAVTPTVEMVPLRKNNNSVEVLLVSREADDPIWPGMLHVPGSVVRATDEKGSFASAFRRIFQNELGNPQIASEPTLLRFLFHQVKRGVEIAFVHWVEIVGEPVRGKFYSVDALPENLIDHQRTFIQEAAKAYTQARS